MCYNLKDTKDCMLVANMELDEAAMNYVKIEPVKNGSAKVIKPKEINETAKNWTISSTVKLEFVKAQSKFVLTMSGKTYPFSVAYNYYESYQGTGQKSGAYIFRPSVFTIAAPRHYSTFRSYQYLEGTTHLALILEGDKTYTTVYFNKLAGYVDRYGLETYTYVDSINIDDKVGKEVVIDITSDISNNKTFFTDSNGMEEQKRVINYRATWPLVTDELASSNYYPVNSHITITNNDRRMTVLVDRSEGGTSLNEGQIELMIHRRTVYDDERGVWEPLNETEADGKGLRQLIRHFVVFGEDYRKTQKRNDQVPVVVWANTTSATFSKKPVQTVVFPVPEQVKMFLRPMAEGNYLLRLHNFDTKNPVRNINM